MAGPQRDFDHGGHLRSSAIRHEKAFCRRHRAGYCDPHAPKPVYGFSVKRKRSTSFSLADLIGGDGEIRTLAPVLTRPTAFRVRTLQPLGYIPKFMLYPCFSTRRPIQPVEIGKNNRIEQATLFNLNSTGTRMVPRVSAVWHSTWKT